MPARRQIGVRLSRELWDRVHNAAQAEDRTVSQIVRWALEAYFGLRPHARKPSQRHKRKEGAAWIARK